MYAVTDQFLQAVRYPYTSAVMVDVWDAGQNVTPPQYVKTGLPITGGSVTADSSAQIRRSLSVTVADPALSPEVAQDLLAPYGRELRVRKGIEYPNGTVELVPQGWFRIDNAQVTVSGQSGPTEISIAASDRSARLVDGRFFNTTPSGAGTVVAEINRLVQAVFNSGPTLIDLTGNTTPCPAQVYDDNDRAGAVDKLATSIGAEFFFDADGNPTVRPVPRPLSARNVFHIDAGATGVMLSAQTAVDRTNIYNAIIVHGKALDGHPTSYAEVLDTSSTSPTRYGGPFGRKPAFFTSPVLTSDAACAAAGQSMLARYTGAGWTIGLTSLVNPALDAGDVIRVDLPDGRQQYHVIDSVTIPLDNTTEMTLTTRTNDPSGDVDESTG